MEAAIVNSFVDAIVTILETYAVGDIKAYKPFIKTSVNTLGEISGVIKLSGEFDGSVAVIFSSDCILGVVSNMFGEEMTEVNDEIKDAVGEMVNMMAGQVNTKMTELEKSLKAELNTVNMGENHAIEHLPGQPVITLPYMSNAGSFLLEVCFND